MPYMNKMLGNPKNIHTMILFNTLFFEIEWRSSLTYLKALIMMPTLR
jgi:hypothetical protein